MSIHIPYTRAGHSEVPKQQHRHHWGLVRHAESQAPPQTCWIRTCICISSPRGCRCPIQLEEHHLTAPYLKATESPVTCLNQNFSLTVGILPWVKEPAPGGSWASPSGPCASSDPPSAACSFLLGGSTSHMASWPLSESTPQRLLTAGEALSLPVLHGLNTAHPCHYLPPSGPRPGASDFYLPTSPTPNLSRH